MEEMTKAQQMMSPSEDPTRKKHILEVAKIHPLRHRANATAIVQWTQSVLLYRRPCGEEFSKPSTTSLTRAEERPAVKLAKNLSGH